MAIELPNETKDTLIYSIKRYLADELDVEIGDLQASFFLDFVLKEVGPSIYNRAILEAQSAMQRAVADLDVTLHEPEFGHSSEQGALRKPSRRGAR